MWPYWHFVSCLFSMISERKTWVRKKWDRMKFYIVWERREVRKEVFDGTYTPKKKKLLRFCGRKEEKACGTQQKKLKWHICFFVLDYVKILSGQICLYNTHFYFSSLLYISQSKQFAREHSVEYWAFAYWSPWRESYLQLFSEIMGGNSLTFNVFV